MLTPPLVPILGQLWQRFYDERTSLVYSYDVPDRDLALPTPAELAAGIPSVAGWGTGVEDCAMNGGLLLAVLANVGDRRRGREIMRGLLRLSEVAPEPGCLARGVLPDGRSRPLNTSCDQLGSYTYGLWAAVRAGLAERDATRRAVRAMAAIAARIESSGWRFLNEDGTVAGGGDRLAAHSAEQAVRLLGLVAAVWSATGDDRWRRAYQGLCDEHDGVRLRAIEQERFWPVPDGWGCYVPEQMQCQLGVLATVDPNPSRGGTYRRAMVRMAEAVLKSAFPGLGHRPAYTARTEAVLGELTCLERPEDWRQWSPELVALEEDWTWRDDWQVNRPTAGGLAGALDFVLGWMGRRPRFCHERTLFRWPLTAYHIALLASELPSRSAVLAEAEALLAEVPLAGCRWADTLVEAAAVAQLAGSSGHTGGCEPADRL